MAAAWCCTPGTPHLYPIPLVLTQQSPSQLCFGPPWLTFPCCLYNVETRAHLFLQLLNGLTLAWDGKLPSGPLYFFLSPPHFQFALSPRSSWEFTSEPELVSAWIPLPRPPSTKACGSWWHVKPCMGGAVWVTSKQQLCPGVAVSQLKQSTSSSLLGTTCGGILTWWKTLAPRHHLGKNFTVQIQDQRALSQMEWAPLSPWCWPQGLIEALCVLCGPTKVSGPHWFAFGLLLSFWGPMQDRCEKGRLFVNPQVSCWGNERV
jgi:hypothetical protein